MIVYLKPIQNKIKIKNKILEKYQAGGDDTSKRRTRNFGTPIVIFLKHTI